MHTGDLCSSLVGRVVCSIVRVYTAESHIKYKGVPEARGVVIDGHTPGHHNHDEIKLTLHKRKHHNTCCT